MKKYYLLLSLIIISFFKVCIGYAEQKFEETQNLVEDAALEWNDSFPSSFYDGAFLGDGLQGAMVMRDKDNSDSLRMLLGHYKAIAHYSIPQWEYCNSRVYAGSIVITPKGDTKQERMKLDLWNGEINGSVNTVKGKFEWTLMSDRKNKVFIVSLLASGEEKPFLDVCPEWGITPRIYLEKKNPADYAEYLPPHPEIKQLDGMNIIVNRMKTRGAHTVVSKRITEGEKQLLYVAIGTSDNRDMNAAVDEATQEAISRIRLSSAVCYEDLRKTNRDWWHRYYQESSLELPQDIKWQRFWWIQLYKFACASSEESDLIMDTQGPWICESAWAAIWWNLNVQLSYMPMYSSNKLKVGKSFINGMNRLFDSGAFHENAQGSDGITVGRSSTYEGKSTWGDEFGNMPWLLHCYWKYWKYSGDDTYGRKLFPMLKESAQFLLSKMEKNDDGKLEMVLSRSPEYTEELYWNANYALMSAKWVLQSLLDMNEYFGFNDAQAFVWRKTLSNLSDYPQDKNGLRISRDQGFEMGHRHYSHLLAVYPYHLLSPYDSQERALIEKSVNHWLTLTKKSGHAGYTYTGGCAMLATLGQGNDALETLNLLYDQKLTPNTMYKEGGGQVIETPLSAVESINYMLLQSWNDIIQVFPAVPDKWKDVCFKNFRTQGAFLVSAERKNGKSYRVSITSEQGQACAFKVSGWTSTIEITDAMGHKAMIRPDENGIYYIETQRGGKYNLRLLN